MRREDLLDLNDALQHPGRKVAVDVTTELSEEADLDLIKPLDGYLEAVSTGNLLLIKGEFTTKAVLECARCTAPIEVDVKFEVDEQFPVEGVPSSFSSQDYARVAPEEPYQLFDSNSLMVDALLRQGLLVNMPLQPLCTFGWDGPCPIAAERGVSRSQDEAGRPAFEKLSKLLDSEDDKA